MNFIDTIRLSNVAMLIGVGRIMVLVIGGLAMLSHHYTLNGIKSPTVGDGQHGTARGATDKEIKGTYAHIPFKVKEWRNGQSRPKSRGWYWDAGERKMSRQRWWTVTISTA